MFYVPFVAFAMADRVKPEVEEVVLPAEPLDRVRTVIVRPAAPVDLPVRPLHQIVALRHVPNPTPCRSRKDDGTTTPRLRLTVAVGLQQSGAFLVHLQPLVHLFEASSIQGRARHRVAPAVRFETLLELPDLLGVVFQFAIHQDTVLVEQSEENLSVGHLPQVDHRPTLPPDPGRRLFTLDMVVRYERVFLPRVDMSNNEHRVFLDRFHLGQADDRPKNEQDYRWIHWRHLVSTDDGIILN